MAAVLPTFRGCPCTNPDTEQFLALFYGALPVLRTLHCVKHILNEEECRSVGKAGIWWDNDLAVVIATNPPGAVQETLGVLEKYKGDWRCDITAKGIKLLSELYQEKLVTEDEVKRMQGEGGLLSDRVVLVQCTKPPEVIARTTNVLDNYGHNEEARQLRVLSELYQEKLVTEDEVKKMKGEEGFLSVRVVRVQYTKPPEVVARTVNVLDKYGHNVEARQLGGEAPMTCCWVPGKRLGLSSDSGIGSSIASTDSGRSSSIAATSTHSSSHLVESYQKMSMPPLAEGPSLSQTELSSEEVEVESKHQGSKVPSEPAGEGSGPPREPDSAAGKGAEAALVDLCWIPFGIQSQLVGPEGGKLSLEPSAGAMGGEEGGTILLEVPPGAVSPAERVEVRSALIPDGPFTLPEGYQLGSMVLYLYYDGHRLTKPCTLSLPHWYGGEDQVRDGLSFAMAPHTLKEGESVYHFELLEGGRFAEQRQCGVLEISGHYTLFAAVFKVKASSLYYASLWTHQVDGAVIADNEMHSKVVITYAALDWIEVLEKYSKDWKRHPSDSPVRFKFSGKKVQGMLSEQRGEGWEASLKGTGKVHSSEVAYHGIYSEEDLESAVKEHVYPPAIHCVVMYESPPDCSRGVKMNKLSIKGTKMGQIDFPFKVYKVKTPHPPSSPSASASSSMGGHTALPSPVDTGDEDTQFSASEFLKKHETEFFEVVNPRLSLLRLVRKGVITEDVKSDITTSNTKDAREVLYRHLAHHANVETLKEYCEVAVDAEGYPKMRSLGRKMMEELPQGASEFSVLEFLKKHETEFFEVVDPRLSLLKLLRKGVITEDVRLSIYTSNTDDAREVLYHHLAHHSNVDTLKEYLRVAIAADGYPKMQSLGRKMMEELEQGGEQTH